MAVLTSRPLQCITRYVRSQPKTSDKSSLKHDKRPGLDTALCTDSFLSLCFSVSWTYTHTHTYVHETEPSKYSNYSTEINIQLFKVQKYLLLKWRTVCTVQAMYSGGSQYMAT